MKNYILIKWNIYKILNDRKKYRKCLAFYSQFIHKDNLCFDVGAHEGNRTEIFLKLGAKVVAVEPQESCINQLRQKFSKKAKFTLVNKGLSDREGELTLYICRDATTISTFSNKWKTGRFSDYKWGENKLVPVTTLDNLIKKFGLPVFCKIDVEGFELKVLKGLSQPISYISFEFTKEFFNDAKFCIDYLFSYLGYQEFNCSLGESMCMLFQNWVRPKELYQRLGSINDSLLWGDIYAKNKIDRLL